MISDKLPKFTGSPQNQIQLLSPGKNSQVGVHALNARLQAAINPNPPISVGANDNDRVVIRNGHQVREGRSEEHTSELQSLMRISYAVFCLKKKKKPKQIPEQHKTN